jgi:hypothetical protein
MNARDQLGYAVRVDFREGDHAYWGWTDQPWRAERRRRRYGRFFQGYGVRAFTVVRIKLGELRQHAVDARCQSPLCPSQWSQCLADRTLTEWPRSGEPLTLSGSDVSDTALERIP